MNGRSAKAKGVRAEQEVARLIHDSLGYDVRRTLAGHADDLGDLTGLPQTVCQVKNFADVGRALREGVAELADQQARAGAPYAAAFIRRPGGRYVVAMNPDQFFALWREAVRPGPDKWPATTTDDLHQPGWENDPEAPVPGPSR